MSADPQLLPLDGDAQPRSAATPGRLVLDADQAQAVGHRTGACLVLAGPGSGKTRVIVERFLALLAEGVAPDEQLVLTYTVKAAAEMRRRAEEACGPFSGDVPLLNFHSFARRVLREWGFLLGVPPTFHVADAAERWLHLDAVLGELRPRTLWNPLRPHDLVDSLLQLIGTAKQELITPAQYAEWSQRRLRDEDDPAERALLERHAECAAVYAAMEERQRRRAALDHDDCILLAERLLRSEPAVRRAVCERVRHVMVDEFQDTNYAQARLVDALVETHGNLMVVADDDQSIYKFRGASRANLERFQRQYPEHRAVVLRSNYRSTGGIVSLSRALILAADARTRIDKHVAAVRDTGDAVELWTAPDERSEALAVATECRRLVESGVPATAIAWLFRRHADMRAAMHALQELQVPYRVHGGQGYWQEPEVKALLGLLTAIADPDDSQALLRCLHLPAWAVSNRGRLALARACERSPEPLLGVVERGDVEGLDDPDLAAAQRCAASLVDLHARALHADVRDLFFDAMEVSGFVGVLDLARDVERMQAGANLNRFGELLEGFADWSDDLRLGAALRYLSILRDSHRTDDVPDIDIVEDGVSLLTAHSAKGLEWPVVFVGCCTDERWPGRTGFAARLTVPDELVPEAAPPGDGHADEERRLFYVACTRAQDRLVLTHAQHYPRSFREERVSRFLGDIAMDAAFPRRRSLPFVPPEPRRRAVPAERTAAPLTEAGVRDLADFRECPRRYEMRRRWRLPVRGSMQQWYGTLMHATLERAGRLRLAGERVDADRLVQLWHESWEAAPGSKGAYADLRGYGEETLRRYGESAGWSEATIAAVESPFELRLGAGRLSGRLDRLDRGAGGTAVVVDYKTGPPRSVESAARDLQVRAYAVAQARADGVDSVSVELHHLQTGEVVRVEHDAQALRRAAGQIEAVTAELARAWDTLRFPATPSPQRCRRCDFRTVCDEVATD